MVCFWGWFLNSLFLLILVGKNSNFDRNYVKFKLIFWFVEIGGFGLDLNFFSVFNLDLMEKDVYFIYLIWIF